MKKILNRKTIIAVIAATMLLFTSAGLTLAYFSANTHAEGALVLNLKGTSVIDEDVDENGTKTVNIENKGQTDLIVRVAIYGPWLTEAAQAADTSYSANDWELMNGYYYYKHILKPGQSTSAITAAISNIPAGSDIDEFAITVVQQAAVVTYDENGAIVKPDKWDNIPSITD